MLQKEEMTRQKIHAGKGEKGLGGWDEKNQS